MNVTQPQSVPEGDSWSAGMIVSTAAEKNASSSGVITRRASGAAFAALAAVAASPVHAARPVAAAAALAPATPAPFKNSRRGSFISAMDILPCGAGLRYDYVYRPSPLFTGK